MPKVIETMWRRVHWGRKMTEASSEGNAHRVTYEANWEQVDIKMNELIVTLTEDGWEIKSVVPLLASRTYVEALTNHQGMSSAWGAGYGYGAAFTDGVVVMAQRWVEVSQEEFDQREKLRAEKAQAKLALAAAKQRQDAHDQIMGWSIERKGLFDASWLFHGENYKTKEEAEAARAKLAKSKLEAV